MADEKLRFRLFGKEFGLKGLFWIMQVLGWMMGIFFPLFVFPFVTFKSPVHFIFFWAACIAAGAVVGWGCFKLTYAASTQFLLSATSIAQRTLGVKLSEAGNGKSTFDLAEEELFNLLDITGLLMKQIRSLSRELNNTAQDISKLSSSHAAAVTQQAASITEISATLEEIAQTSNQIATSVRGVEKQSSLTFESVNPGKEDVYSTAEKFRTVKKQTDELTGRIAEMVRKVENVSEVLKFIDEVADQTKILALNASIEAARAGEAGKGFSVVANEIRKLAESVVESTERIRDIVNEVSSLATSVAAYTEINQKEVTDGMEKSRQAENRLDEIQAAARNTKMAIEQIVTAVDQEKSATNQIARTMKEIEKAAKDAVEVTSVMSRISREIGEKSRELNEMLEKLSAQKVMLNN